MKQITVLFLLAFFMLPAFVRADEFDPDSIVSIVHKVANYRLEDKGATGIPATWDGGAYYTGITAAWRLTKDDRYRDAIMAWSAANGWACNNGNPDNHCACQTYTEMYILEPEPANASRYAAWKTYVDANLAKTPHAPGRAIWYWIDALYMAPPGMSMLGQITGDSTYWHYLLEIWWDVTAALYDTTYDFYYRDAGFIRSKCTDSAWCIAANGGPVFWAPGNAWTLGGMARVLKYMPDSYPGKAAFVDHFREFCTAVAAQQQDTGLWTTSLLDHEQWPKHETSSTAFFCFAMAWGINEGLLDPNFFLPVVEKAWSGLVRSVDPKDGRLHWCQHVNMRPFDDIDQWFSSAEGEGAFLQAGEEMHRLVSDPPTGVSLSHPGDQQAFVNGFRLMPVDLLAGLRIPSGTRSVRVLSLSGQRIMDINPGATLDPAAFGRKGLVAVEFRR